jgi:hypothetical protein
MTIVKLTIDEVLECKQFCMRSAISQQQIEFGNHNTKSRSVIEIARDNAIGKLAETAFCSFVKQWGIDIKPDYNIYPRGKWDDSDFIINSNRLDLKATRTGGNWLLVETSKIEFRKTENKLPDYFIFCVTGWDKARDKFTGEVDICGYISLEDLLKSKIIFEGGYIPNTFTRLQTHNHAIHRTDLKEDWETWIKRNITLAEQL